MKNLNFRKVRMKNNNFGITLIALVVSIIVLLILAGISISMLSGDNSILQKATDAKEQTEIAELQEKADMIFLEEVSNKYNNKGTISLETIKNKLQTEGYTIVPGDSGVTINSINLSTDALTVAKNRKSKNSNNNK